MKKALLPSLPSISTRCALAVRRMMLPILIVIGCLPPALRAQTQPYPAAPTNPTLSLSLIDNTHVGIQFTWTDNATDENGYEIDSFVQGSSGWGLFAYMPANSTNVSAVLSSNNLTAGANIAFRVRSLKGTFVSTSSFTPLTSWSAFATSSYVVWPDPSADTVSLNAPVITGATYPATNVLRLAWTDNTNSEYTQFVEAKDVTAGSSTFYVLGAADFNLKSFDFLNYLLPGHTYDLRMRAGSLSQRFSPPGSGYNATTAVYSYSPYSNVITTTAPGTLATPPASPTNLTVAAYNDGTNYRFSINWDDRSDTETHFEIQEKTTGDPDANYQSLGLLDGLSGQNKGIGIGIANGYNAGADKTFRVRAVTGQASDASLRLNSNWTNAAASVMNVFGAPSDVRLNSPNDDGKIELFWEDNATTEVGYDLEFRTGGTGSFTSLGKLSSPSYSRYQSDGGIGGFPPSTQVEFRLRAYQGTTPNFTYTAYSNTASAVTQPLSAPTNATLSQITKNSAHLSWTDHSLNETNYQVLFRITGSGSGFSLLQSGLPGSPDNVDGSGNHTPTSGGTLFTDLTGLTPGTSYDIVVRASYDYSNGTSIAGTNSATVVLATKDGFISNPYAPITLNVPFTYQATTSNPGLRTSWSFTGLPPGITFDSNTGILSGTPTSAGLYLATRTVLFSNGTTESETFSLRVLTPSGAPVIAASFPDQTLGLAGSFNVSLAGKFSDPDADSAVRLNTTLGSVDMILYNTLTPQTVANFMTYVTAGDYTDAAFHRSESNFVVQGGGYKPASSPDNFTEVIDRTAVQNEPGISNLTGTIAMAKLGGNPNSATNEFFFNLGNNSANLDNQNGGFTVFGRVATPSMSVVTAMAALPTKSYYINIAGQLRGPFDNWPMNVPGAAPSSMNIANIIKINSAASIPVLTYSITGNTNSSAVGAAISGANVTLTPLAVGSSTITVTATDLDGHPVTQSFLVTIVPASTNASLSNLTTTAGSLTPVFDSATLSYSAGTVANAVSSVTVTPTTADTTATIKVNNATVVSGSASPAVSLAVGLNTITTVVTAQDGTTTKTYTIDITRAVNPAEIALEEPAGTNLTDGVSSSAFGSVNVGSNIVKTYTIKNLGTGDLTGLAVTKDGPNASDFTVNTSGMNATVSAGGNTTFTVTFAPSVSGAKTAAIHVASNDSDENPFDIALAGNGVSAKAEMITPVSGSTLTSASVTFSWNIGTTATSYALWIGSSAGASDVYAGIEGTSLAKTVTVPDDGRTLYVTLWSLVNGAYQGNAYTYTAYTAPKAVKAQITSPVNGSTLASTALTLTWNAGVGVTQYVLWVGTTPGGYDLYAGVETLGTKAVTVPASGAKVYVTLYSLIKGSYQANYYQYVTAAPVKAQLTSPVDGATLSNGTLNLTWTTGTGVSRYYLFVGSSYGGYDLGVYDVGTATNRSVTVPTDGGPIYLTLWSLINGAFQSNSYWFLTAPPVSGSQPAALTSPTNTSVLTTAEVNFTWTAGVNASQYALWVGSSPDGYDLHASLEGTAQSKQVTLPTDGRRIYVTLHSLISGAWQSNSYYFTTLTTPPTQAAQITSPANGSVLTSGSLNLIWNVTGATSYALWVGSNPGAYDLYAGNEGTGTAKVVTVPTDGRPIYVTLYSLINGAYQQTSAWYSAQAATDVKAKLSAPAPNTTSLTAASTTFTWSIGSASQIALWIGSTPGGYDLLAGSEGTKTTETIQLPTDGRKIYVTLWSLIGGAYQGNSYYFTAATISPAKATMTTPAGNTTFTATSVTFNWNGGTNVTSYALWVSRKPGGYDVYASNEGGATSKTLALPADGGPIYVTLWSLINGSYQSSEYVYQTWLSP